MLGRKNIENDNMSKDAKEMPLYLIPAQKRKRVSQGRLYEMLTHLCNNQLPDGDAKHVSDIVTGVAMYEAPMNSICFANKEDIKALSLTTINFNQISSYFFHKYGYINGSVMMWIIWAAAKVRGDMKKLKAELKINAKQLSRTRVKDMQKQGQLIIQLIEKL